MLAYCVRHFLTVALGAALLMMLSARVVCAADYVNAQLPGNPFGANGCLNSSLAHACA